MDPNRNLIYGERVEHLIPVLLAISKTMTRKDDGMIHIDAALQPEIALPFLRATMRVEAELLLEDADAIGGDSYEPRTPEQRAADTFVRLARTVADAFSTAA